MNSNSNILDIKEILKILPHRYPFLLVDRILSVKKFKCLTAIKNCTINEPFFRGHFLEEPVFPGVLMIEAMTQAAAILIYKSTGELKINKLYYFVGIDKTRFKKIVIPGDQIFIKVIFSKSKKNFIEFKIVAMVDEKNVCKSSVIFAKKVLG